MAIGEVVRFDFLSLTVRDSAARLPNGEGTRGEICELLKDSQFLAPGVTDAQVNYSPVTGTYTRYIYRVKMMICY